MDLRKPVAALLLAAVSLSAQLAVAAPAQVSFEASKECAVYTSTKKNKSNPGAARISAGQSYQVHEVNNPNHPSWYLVTVPGAEPQERWVAAECGGFKGEVQAHEGGKSEVRNHGPSRHHTASKGNGAHEKIASSVSHHRKSHGGGGKQGVCHTPGKQQSYVLALSWEPALILPAKAHRLKPVV